MMVPMAVIAMLHIILSALTLGLCYTAVHSLNCPIYLTVSLAGKTLQDSCLEIHWGPECHTPPEWVGIFREDPSVSNLHAEARFTDVTNSSGKILTDIKIGKLRFPKGWNRKDLNSTPTEYPKGKCLPYYLASFNGNELLTVECLKIQPNWMSKIRYISQMPLKHLFIPGTHASGAYLSNITKIQKSTLMRDYAMAQHFDVWSQLVFGIRYLDLSIGFQMIEKYDTNDPRNYWIVNENLFANQLQDVLRDVKRFVKLSGEVVILEFSSFPIGFYKHPERHSDLLHLLKEEIGDITYTRMQAPTPCDQLSVDDVRKNDKGVIILYPLQELPYPENESDLLCPSWKRFSTNFMNTSQTLEYMRLLFSKKPDGPVQDEGWVFQAVRNLEQSWNSAKLQTAKERADTINPKIVNWLRGPWGQTANVVAMDYFGNTNIIDVAIYANLQKAFSMANRNYVQFEIMSN